MSVPLEARVRDCLRQIHPVTLQKLAEDLASIKFPNRFGFAPFLRAGRNDEDQTTKGWPDAYVMTSPEYVDGVEATRDRSNWRGHLQEDLRKAADPKYNNLSGYVFVGGYPNEAPTKQEIDDWIAKFASMSIPSSNVTILVGDDLVLELCRPEYAGLRQRHLGLPAATSWFRLMGQAPLNDRRLGPFQPTQDEYDAHLVSSPSVMDAVLNDLLSQRESHVRGLGAAGKTTFAELIARHPRIQPNAAWYLDLANAPESMTGSGILNEMAELSGPGVLFIVDNVHLDEGRGSDIHTFWSKHFHRGDGAGLLMLGRMTQLSSRAPAAHELRAGIPEMRAVVQRLAARERAKLSEIPEEALKEWAKTFGAKAIPGQTAVDLIAFTAAVDRRFENLLDGDFRLSTKDAVDVVRTRYLQPLETTGELQNVLRLAALADLEIGVVDDDLTDPVAGLWRSTNEFGIVVTEQVGMERRRVNRLVHASIGHLLVDAASTTFDLQDTRRRIAAARPQLGRRIVANLRKRSADPAEIRRVETATDEALRSEDWPDNVLDFYGLESLARHVVHCGYATAGAVDGAIVGLGTVDRLVQRSPALPALIKFMSAAKTLQLKSSLDAMHKGRARAQIVDLLHFSRPGDTVSFLRGHPRGGDFLQSLEHEKWTRRQAHVALERASVTVSVVRFFEAAGRPELAVAPAMRQVLAAEPALWYNRDFSHLSHVLRCARPTPSEAERLLQALSVSGWLRETYQQGILGQLCGALMSFANHLAPELRPHLLTDDLGQRVMLELTRLTSGEHLSRPICLLGGFDALGGVLPQPPHIDWSADPNAERALADVAHSGVTGAIGMYELQLWAGLRAASEAGAGPPEIHGGRGRDFRYRLANATPPSHAAVALQAKLMEWLDRLDVTGWRPSAITPAL